MAGTSNSNEQVNNSIKSIVELTTRIDEQVNNSIKSIVELTTRIDERVQLMMKKQETFETKMEDHLEYFNELKTEFKLLDSKSGKSLQEEVVRLSQEVNSIQSKLEALTKESSKLEGDWKYVVKGTLSFIVQIIWVLLASYMLYKLGIQSPSVP